MSGKRDLGATEPWGCQPLRSYKLALSHKETKPRIPAGSPQALPHQHYPQQQDHPVTGANFRDAIEASPPTEEEANTNKKHTRTNMMHASRCQKIKPDGRKKK
ncbi:hypothetical protein PUN28_020458 [Cardiocondyla obscurior]|uniref:Uncharacterized protein n=1 Tax=Cardiocondyla obscurior TaxID=286306 RepID=A0AAW2EA43_9HYME